MNVFPVNHTTYHRRRLQAQKFYLQLIHKGVFNHNLQNAYSKLKELEPHAMVEHIKYLFNKR